MDVTNLETGTEYIIDNIRTARSVLVVAVVTNQQPENHKTNKSN